MVFCFVKICYNNKNGSARLGGPNGTVAGKAAGAGSPRPGLCGVFFEKEW